LLQAHEQPDNFLEAPAAGPVATVDWPITEKLGTVIGPYKLMEQIGEGGFGLVFVAEQQQPVRRKVALKVIKPGMDSRDVIARFEAERQALALMDHPNIAKVLDAGTTESGRPYFVMELVKGISITDYCDQNQLTPRERLELFTHVCQAVQHAHTKGVIHRDLKPSNILVTLHDGTPVVKVIDFGVAKAIGQHLTDKTIYTRYAQLIGTPLYMSPEQAEMSGLDIDTRSDVYSLGVLLYELLTGMTPFDRKRLGKAAFDEVRRILREEEPPKPSTRLSALGESLSAVSAKRKMEPRKLSALVTGDLDWIVMKALEKDRSRRYETASSLAADVRRFLGEEPVEARPPSAWYRFRKLARRNKVALTTAALVAATLLLGTVVSAWQAVRATRAQTAARAAEDEATKERDRALDAEKLANEEKTNAQATLQFLLSDVLEQANPLTDEPILDLKVGTMLDSATRRLEQVKGLTPSVEAAIRKTMGKIYRGLCEFEKAERQLRQAYALYKQRDLNEDHPDTQDAMRQLAGLYALQGDIAKAEPMFFRNLEVARQRLGNDHPNTLLAINRLAMLYEWSDQPDRGEPLLVEALQISRRLYRDQDPQVLLPLARLAATYVAQGRYTEAERLFNEYLKSAADPAGDQSFARQGARLNLAYVYLKTGHLDEAEKLVSDVYRYRLGVLGALHFGTLYSRGILAQIHLAKGMPVETDPYLQGYREMAEHYKDRLPPFIVLTFRDLGMALLERREFTEAELFLQHYLDHVAQKPLGRWQPFAAEAAIGACLLGRKKYAEAERRLVKGCTGLQQHKDAIPGSQRVRLTEALGWLVQLYEEWDKPDDAAKWRKELEALRVREK
jgi:serine/threonine protein kinase/tetratricopeptide (TPR) repeat protein